jgi:cytochrome c oxidase subunit 3
MSSVNHAPLAHQFDDLEQQRSADALGMWVFLATEVMVFGALFTGYVSYRMTYPQAFEEGSRHLNLLIGGVNTIVLLTSSLTMALAVRSTRVSQRRASIGFLAGTVLLGSAFLVLKAVEYYEDYREQLVPVLAFQPAEWAERGFTPRHIELFLLCYYFLTGLHALHMTIGLGVLTVLIIMAWRGRFSSEHYMPVEVTGLYWHFVDVIWIFLLPLLYLVGTRTSFF